MKLLAILLTFVGMIKANEDETKDKGLDDNEQPFVETGAFIGIVVAAAVVLACLLCCCTCTISNSSWVQKNKEQFEAMTQTADTKKGKIEFRQVGSAPYALYMVPGCPSFAHQDYGLTKNGFGMILVSRPGFARTPLTEENKTAPAQADLIMALMDQLGIENFPIFAFSGAGPIALRLAIQYPDRVQCLGMQACATGGYVHPMTEFFHTFGAKVTNYPSVNRLMVSFAEGDLAAVIKEDLKTANSIKPGCITDDQINKRAQEIMNDPNPFYKDFLTQMPGCLKLDSCYPHNLQGMISDLEHIQKPTIPFDQVKVPVHLIHGEADADTAYSQAVQAHEGIAGSVLITQPNGTHSTMYHPEYQQNLSQQLNFVKKHCGLAYDQEIVDKKL